MKTQNNTIAIDKLITAARKAMKYAHAPYSKYKVGAALLCKDGSIYSGCNVENASYGLTVCAERTALLKAVSDGKRKFSAIAITSTGKKAQPYPCGACRQAMAEFCDKNFVIIVLHPSGRYATTSLGELLPNSFAL